MATTTSPAAAAASADEDLPIAHISDSHLGYEAYLAQATNGLNQRGFDVVRSLDNCVRDILEYDPPLVIHSGDVFDKATGTPHQYYIEWRRQLTRLAGVRKDGTRRQVVVIAGNHDQPYSRQEPCILELWAGLPGVHIVTQHYTMINFRDVVAAGEADPRLQDVLVHAIPHDDLKTMDFDAVQPVEGFTNILTAHGVAGGSELFVRSLGREYAIPSNVLSRPWAYVALGHWHKQGPVGVRPGADSPTAAASNIWYAGSHENISFRDLRDNGTQRGYLQVQVAGDGKPPAVTARNMPIRPMFRLPVIDATGMTPEQITDALKANIRSTDLSGAVVGQIVENVTRDVWGLVDITGVRALAMQDALHYEGPTGRFSSPKAADGTTIADRGLGSLADKLQERAAALFAAEEDRAPALELARKLLGSALDAGPEADDTPTPAVRAAKDPAQDVTQGTAGAAATDQPEIEAATTVEAVTKAATSTPDAA